MEQSRVIYSKSILPLHRLTLDYLERMQSLTQDGYEVISTATSSYYYQCSLRHSKSAKRITLFADFVALTLTQRTNGVVKYQAVYK